MNILDKIIEAKRLEIANQKSHVDIETLMQIPEFDRECNSLKSALLQPGSSGIIAEFKKRSPSKGDINLNAKVEEVTKDYTDAGAAGLSVLTEKNFFGGSQACLVKAREINTEIPILRKDFMIDPYQLIEAKAYGADVILLIAACLTKNEVELLATDAKKLGLEVILEVHNEAELEKINELVDIVGINNRDLKTFNVDIETSVKLAKLIPNQFLKISESGISSAQSINYLKENGFNGFLIGETFMKTQNPGAACRKLIKEIEMTH